MEIPICPQKGFGEVETCEKFMHKRFQCFISKLLSDTDKNKLFYKTLLCDPLKC